MPYKDPQKQKEFQQKRMQNNRKFVRRVKLFKGCELCGYKRHFASLSFDHLDPMEKDRTGRKSIDFGWGRDRIKNEMRKCRVLCMNCHQEQSYIQEHHFINSPWVSF